MINNNFDDMKDKKAKLWQLFLEPEFLQSFRHDLQYSRKDLIKWCNGKPLDLVEVKAILGLYCCVYVKMFNPNNYLGGSEQAMIDKFVPLDKESIVLNPEPRTIEDLFLSPENRLTVLNFFKLMIKDLKGWLENKEVAFSAVFMYVEIFTEIYKLMCYGSMNTEKYFLHGIEFKRLPK